MSLLTILYIKYTLHKKNYAQHTREKTRTHTFPIIGLLSFERVKMGVRTSRHNLQNKDDHFHEISDQQRCDTLHMDTHYDVIENILKRHVTIIDSKISTQQIAMNIHRDALNIAIQQHLDAVYFQQPNYQRARQMVYAC